jgi:hypothetical protein
MHGKMESVRQADYRGHHIVIRTRYQIEVDGRMLMGHMGVTNDGQVHYHPVPNLSFASAVDLVKRLIGSQTTLPTKLRGSRHSANSAWRFGIGAQKQASKTFSWGFAAKYAYGGTLDVGKKDSAPVRLGGRTPRPKARECGVSRRTARMSLAQTADVLQRSDAGSRAELPRVFVAARRP